MSEQLFEFIKKYSQVYWLRVLWGEVSGIELNAKRQLILNKYTGRTKFTKSETEKIKNHLRLLKNEFIVMNPRIPLTPKFSIAI